MSYFRCLVFIFVFIAGNAHSNGTTCPALPAVLVSTDCYISIYHGSTPMIAFANYLAPSGGIYVADSCSFKSAPSLTRDMYDCYRRTSASGVVYSAPFSVACNKTFTCPANYTLNTATLQCVATSLAVCDQPPPVTCALVINTITNPAPGIFTSCMYKVEAPNVESCPSQSALDAGNYCTPIDCGDGYQAFGLPGQIGACPPPTNCPVEHPHTHNITLYQCAPDDATDCPAVHPHTHNVDAYTCEPDPIRQCSVENPHTHNISDYECADDDETPCPIYTHHAPGDKYGACLPDPPPTCGPGYHAVGRDCVAEDTPPPDDGTGGGGTGGGTGGGGTGDGTGGGGTGDGTGGGGSGAGDGTSCSEPPSCTGDPIQCAILKATFEGSCKPSDVTQDDVDTALGGVTVEDPPTTSLANLDSSGLGVAGSCPAPHTYGTAAFAFSVDLSGFCDLAAIFGYLLMVTSSFISLRILAG